MARYTGPRCKKCRREGEKLFLKGEKCYTDRCPVPRRATEQKGGGKRRGKKLSAYSLQLREKQKLRNIYGLSERQFHLSYERANRMDNPADYLLILLERRLDNVIYRLGFANSRAQARQLVRHGDVKVGTRRTNIPSFLVTANQTINVTRTKSVAGALENRDPSAVVPWLQLEREQCLGRVLRLPGADDVHSIPCNPQLIVELYSK